jgi:hypothetical protein
MTGNAQHTCNTINHNKPLHLGSVPGVQAHLKAVAVMVVAEGETALGLAPSAAALATVSHYEQTVISTKM